MLRILGSGVSSRNGLDRREVLRAGGLSLFGLTTPGLLEAMEQSRVAGEPHARSQ